MHAIILMPQFSKKRKQLEYYVKIFKYIWVEKIDGQ